MCEYHPKRCPVCGKAPRIEHESLHGFYGEVLIVETKNCFCSDYDDTRDTSGLALVRYWNKTVAGYGKEPPRKIVTNLKRIKSYNAELMAVMLTELLMARDRAWQRKLAEQGIQVDIVHLGFDEQAKIHREWLESEVDADEACQGDQETEGGV